MTKGYRFSPSVAGAARPLALLLPLLLLLFGQAVVAAEASSRAARVVLVRGEVSVTNAAQQRLDLKKDDLVRVGDTVETGPRGFAQIVFDDRMVMAVKANSRLLVEAFHFDPARPDQDQAVTQLLKGGMRAMTGLLGSRSPEQMTVGTRLATIGFRGTAVEAEDQEDGGVRVTFDFGRGFTAGPNGRLDLTAGESAGLKEGEAPAPLDFQRPPIDPAALAGGLLALSPAEAAQRMAELAPTLSQADLMLTIALLHEAPGYSDEHLLALLKGAAGVLPPEQRAELAGLATRLNPVAAKQILGATFGNPAEMVPVALAVVHALEGMPNAAVDDLLGFAMKLGMSPPQVFQLMEELRNHPLVCK